MSTNTPTLSFIAYFITLISQPDATDAMLCQNAIALRDKIRLRDGDKDTLAQLLRRQAVITLLIRHGEL